MIFRRIISVLLAVFFFTVSVFLPDSKACANFIVSRMTLEQKVCQLLMPSFNVWYENGKKNDVTVLNSAIKASIKKHGFGGVILFAENCGGASQTADLVFDLQHAALNGGAQIPMLIGIDQEGGYITRLGTGTRTCGNMALGALNDTAETELSASIIGSELYSLGINTDFAPDADVNSDPSNPVIGIRSFSSDENIAASMTAAYIRGLHSQGVAAAAKHFPGHGDTDIDSHTGLPVINKTLSQLEMCELVPFKAAIDAGTDIIMTAHIEYPQIEKSTYTSVSSGKKIYLPATLSKTVVTDILRNKLGYSGVVCTDALNMGAIAENFKPLDAAVLSVNAGVDLLLMPVTAADENGIAELDTYIQNLVNAVKTGKIPEKRINESAVRIVDLKIKRNIIRLSYPTRSQMQSLAAATVGCASHRKAELKTAQKAITLLKNDGALPAQNGAVLFYPYAGEQVSLKYGGALLKAGGTVNGDFGFTAFCYRGKKAADFKNQIKNASGVIVFTESYSAAYLNKKSADGWQAVFTDDLITLSHALGKKVTAVSLDLPYDAARYTAADALVLAYGAKDMKTMPRVFGSETPTYGINIPAAVTVIFGGAAPRGKSPVDIMRVDQNGAYTNTVLYPVGSGISYRKGDF